MKLVFGLLVAPTAALKVASVASSTAATVSPVENVVNLLKDLKAKTEADGKAEQQSYDKFACWCETTSKRKADAINQAAADLRALGQSILTLKGTVAVRTAEIAQLNEDIRSNQDEQEDATAVRSKESAAFMAESAEEKQAIAALQKAVKVLVGGTNRASLLQTSVQASRSAVSDLLQVLPSKVAVKPEQVSLLSTFSKSGYAPQSESIQGILKDMYETMTSNLESSTSSEADSNREFENFIGIKTKELGVLRETKATKKAEKAEAEQQLADTTETYDNTETQRKADIKFFDATKEACKAKSDEWDVRRDLRTEELQGIDKAIEILTSDEARALFASSIKPGKETFLQVGSSNSVAVAASRAYDSLKSSARKAHSVRLAALAARVHEAKSGHFDAVIKAIDEMIAELKEENTADIAKRDQCKSEMNNQASTIGNINWLVDKNLAKIDKLERLIAKRTTEKEETIASIKEVEAQIADMKEQRKNEHAEFLNSKKEDEATVELLKAAKEALTAYSKKNKVEMGPIQGSVNLLQDPVFEVSEDQAPETTFSGKGSRKQQSKGIVGLMSMLLEDAQDEIKNGIKNEKATQAEFEKQLKAAEDLKEDLIGKKQDLATQIANLNEKKDEENNTMDSNNKDLKDEKDYLAKITPDCDWIIGSFEKRAGARAAEMEGLSGAKESLMGA